MEKVKILSDQEDTCPYCNSKDLRYDAIECVDTHLIYFPVHCRACNRDYEEYHTLTFCGNNVGDGCCTEACDVLGREIEMEEN